MVQIIRIKVIEASRLVLIAAIVLFVVVAALAIRHFVTSDATPTSTQAAPTLIVERGTEEAAAAVSAPPSVSPLSLWVPDENEHTDAEADGFDIVILPRDTPNPPESPSAAPAEPPAMIAPASARRVLVYHTHSHEAYAQNASDPYVQTEAWRTADKTHSIVRVGEELAALLRGFGLEVAHDLTDHEPPKLGTAYVRSLATLEKYQDTPFDLYIDLHRDAYDESIGQARAVSAGGLELAQLMMLIGNGEGFEEKPDTQRNLAFARALTDRLNGLSKGICRPVLVKTGRYNQHVGTPSILVEVGHNENTLSEALASMPYLARAIAEQLS